MTITPASVLSLRTALLSLDKFKFDAKTTYSLAKTLGKVEKEVEALEKKRKELYTDSGSPVANTPEYAPYLEKWEALLISEAEIKDLDKVSYESLNVGTEDKQNAIGVPLLHALSPIVEE